MAAAAPPQNVGLRAHAQRMRYLNADLSSPGALPHMLYEVSPFQGGTQQISNSQTRPHDNPMTLDMISRPERGIDLDGIQSAVWCSAVTLQSVVLPFAKMFDKLYRHITLRPKHKRPGASTIKLEATKSHLTGLSSLLGNWIPIPIVEEEEKIAVMAPPSVLRQMGDGAKITRVGKSHQVIVFQANGATFTLLAPLEEVGVRTLAILATALCRAMLKAVVHNVNQLSPYANLKFEYVDGRWLWSWSQNGQPLTEYDVTVNDWRATAHDVDFYTTIELRRCAIEYQIPYEHLCEDWGRCALVLQAWGQKAAIESIQSDIPLLNQQQMTDDEHSEWTSLLSEAQTSFAYPLEFFDTLEMATVRPVIPKVAAQLKIGGSMYQVSVRIDAPVAPQSPAWAELRYGVIGISTYVDIGSRFQVQGGDCGAGCDPDNLRAFAMSLSDAKLSKDPSGKQTALNALMLELGLYGPVGLHSYVHWPPSRAAVLTADPATHTMKNLISQSIAMKAYMTGAPHSGRGRRFVRRDPGDVQDCLATVMGALSVGIDEPSASTARSRAVAAQVLLNECQTRLFPQNLKTLRFEFTASIADAANVAAALAGSTWLRDMCEFQTNGALTPVLCKIPYLLKYTEELLVSIERLLAYVVTKLAGVWTPQGAPPTLDGLQLRHTLQPAQLAQLRGCLVAIGSLLWHGAVDIPERWRGVVSARMASTRLRGILTLSSDPARVPLAAAALGVTPIDLKTGRHSTLVKYTIQLFSSVVLWAPSTGQYTQDCLMMRMHAAGISLGRVFLTSMLCALVQRAGGQFLLVEGSLSSNKIPVLAIEFEETLFFPNTEEAASELHSSSIAGLCTSLLALLPDILQAGQDSSILQAPAVHRARQSEIAYSLVENLAAYIGRPSAVHPSCRRALSILCALQRMEAFSLQLLGESVCGPIISTAAVIKSLGIVEFPVLPVESMHVGGKSNLIAIVGMQEGYDVSAPQPVQVIEAVTKEPRLELQQPSVHEMRTDLLTQLENNVLLVANVRGTKVRTPEDRESNWRYTAKAPAFAVVKDRMVASGQVESEALQHVQDAIGVHTAEDARTIGGQTLQVMYQLVQATASGMAVSPEPPGGPQLNPEYMHMLKDVLCALYIGSHRKLPQAWLCTVAGWVLHVTCKTPEIVQVITQPRQEDDRTAREIMQAVLSGPLCDVLKRIPSARSHRILATLDRLLDVLFDPLSAVITEYHEAASPSQAEDHVLELPPDDEGSVALVVISESSWDSDDSLGDSMLDSDDSFWNGLQESE